MEQCHHNYSEALELHQGPWIFVSPADLKVVAVALLLVKYCLLGGTTTITSPSSEMWTTRGVAGCLEPQCLDSTTLVLLRLGDLVLSSPIVTASVNIGSTRGSARGTARYGSYFSTTAFLQMDWNWQNMPELIGAFSYVWNWFPYCKWQQSGLEPDASCRNMEEIQI